MKHPQICLCGLTATSTHQVKIGDQVVAIIGVCDDHSLVGEEVTITSPIREEAGVILSMTMTRTQTGEAP